MESKKDKENLKYSRWIGIASVMVLLLPIGLGWIIPKESIIKGFTQSNDWIGFFGSYSGAILGGIATLVALWFTRADTRNIQDENTKLQQKNIELQERLIKIEEENQFREHRAFFIEGAIQDNFRFSANPGFYECDLLIKNNHYNDITRMIEKLCLYTVQGDSDISKEAQSRLDAIKGCDKLNYKFLKNIGNNPMFNVTINIEGYWYRSETQIEPGILKFSIDCIEKDRKVILPLFRLIDEDKIISFDVFKMKVIYEVGVMNSNIEKVFADFKYAKDEAKVSREIKIEKIYENKMSMYDYNDYIVIHSKIN